MNMKANLSKVMTKAEFQRYCYGQYQLDWMRENGQTLWSINDPSFNEDGNGWMKFGDFISEGGYCDYAYMRNLLPNPDGKDIPFKEWIMYSRTIAVPGIVASVTELPPWHTPIAKCLVVFSINGKDGFDIHVEEVEVQRSVLLSETSTREMYSDAVKRLGGLSEGLMEKYRLFGVALGLALNDSNAGSLSLYDILNPEMQGTDKLPALYQALADHIADMIQDIIVPSNMKAAEYGKYALYGENLISDDRTLAGFAESIMENFPDEIAAVKNEDDFYSLMDTIREFITDDISRTAIDYEELMARYAGELGKLMYYDEDYGRELPEIRFFGDEAKASFEGILYDYIDRVLFDRLYLAGVALL